MMVYSQKCPMQQRLGNWACLHRLAQLDRLSHSTGDGRLGSTTTELVKVSDHWYNGISRTYRERLAQLQEAAGDETLDMDESCLSSG